MSRLRRVMREYSRSGAVNAICGPACFVDPDNSVFLTKSWDLGVALSLRGADYECKDQSYLEAVSREWGTALRLFGEEYRIYQYAIKTSHPDIPCADYEDPATQQAAGERIRHIKECGSDLYDIRLYMVVMLEKWRKASPGFSLIPNHTVYAADLAKGTEKLLDRAQVFIRQVGEEIGPRLLSREDTFRFFRRLLNFNPDKARTGRLLLDRDLDYQVCDSGITKERKRLVIDDVHATVMTVKEPPSETYTNMLSRVYALPCDCIVATTFKREDQIKTRKKMTSARNFMSMMALPQTLFSAVTSVMGGSEKKTDATTQGMLYDQSKLGMCKQLGEAMAGLTMRNEYYGDFAMYVVLHGDEGKVKNATSEIYRIFNNSEGVAVEETENILTAYLSIIPGNRKYNVREYLISNKNYEYLSLIFAIPRGEDRNPHLDSEFLTALTNKHGGIHLLNLYRGDVGNVLLTGAIGSGKTFLTSMLVGNYQKNRPLTFILDMKRSYEDLTRHFGGSWIPVGPGRREFSINPFAAPATAETYAFLTEFVKVLMQSGGGEMSSQDETDLYDNIVGLYSPGIDASVRRLSTLRDMLRSGLRRYLNKWCDGGQYGAIFDNAADTLSFQSRWMYFEFEDMEDHPDVLGPMLFYVLHRIRRIVYDPALNAELKLLVLDEVWRLIENPSIQACVTEALKTWRDRTAPVLLCTQSVEDFSRTAMLPVVLDCCPTKIFLANPGLDKEKYARVFNINMETVEAIQGLKAKRDLLVVTPEYARLLEFNPSEKEKKMYAATSRY